MTTGQLIKKARRQVGLTQKELGERLGITYQTIAQWENDLRKPKPETLEKIAAALEVDFLDLLPKDWQGVYFAAYMLRHPEITVEDDEGNVIIQGTGRIYDTSSGEKLCEKISDPKARVDAAFNVLNSAGQEKAADAVEVIAGNPKYQRQEASESPPSPQVVENNTGGYSHDVSILNLE